MYIRKFITLSALTFVVVGGLNWGFVALLGYDPISPILGGNNSLLTRFIYGLVGISSLITFYQFFMTPGGDDTKIGE